VLKHLSFSTPDEGILQQVRRMFFAEAETLERLGRHDQIPQLLAYFEDDGEFYLVQEFIDGHPLSEELAGGKRLSEESVVEVLEDVLQVLDFVHAHQVVHRDLKPENLIRRDRDRKLVLIDFGAVKTIDTALAEDLADTQMSLPVYTSGYAASEQCLGKPRFNSDLYSLGMIAIQALTGVRPSQLAQHAETGELVWRDRANVSDDLAIVLETMTKFHFTHRYQTAKQALEALRQVNSAFVTQVPFTQLSKFDVWRSSPPSEVQEATPPKRPLKLALAGLGAAALVGVSTWALIQNRSSRPPVTLSGTNPTLGLMSSGETLLSPTPSTPIKQAGIDKIRQGKFTEAVQLLQQARQADKTDPETLIYLNNARIGQEKAYAIAVVVPLRTHPQSSIEVLRGVAQAQDQLNRANGIDGVKLKVAIASDNSQPDLARQIAKQLTSDPNILGVIGHGTSDTTIAAGEIYQAGELVAISPVSSAKDLSGFSQYVFRTMPSDELPAKQLAAYMVKQLKKRRVAIFYNSTSLYSNSLKESFKDALYYADKGEVVAEIDLSSPSFEAAESVDRVIKNKAEVILLAPNSDSFDRSLLVINTNRKRLPILAGDALYLRRILNESGDLATGMTVAVPSAQTNLASSPFEKQGRSLWGKSGEWRSALGYDAAQAMISAMQKAQTRNGIRSALSLPNFAAIGAVQSVSFTKNGDREMAIALMRVTRSKSGQYEFRPAK
jgi:ABC-type branched-subunit amino acid transport system substrate-binding protein/serine/threonine protein kinase